MSHFKNLTMDRIMCVFFFSLGSGYKNISKSFPRAWCLASRPLSTTNLGTGKISYGWRHLRRPKIPKKYWNLFWASKTSRGPHPQRTASAKISVCLRGTNLLAFWHIGVSVVLLHLIRCGWETRLAAPWLPIFCYSSLGKPWPINWSMYLSEMVIFLW